MPNVRQVFERAYGPIPEGATCHVGYSVPYEGSSICATYELESRCYSSRGGGWSVFSLDEPEGPDISDRDAEAFRGFFDAAYDAALDALKKEEAEDSIHPDEIIKIANALAKFVTQGGDTEWAKDMAGYYLAASGIYERLSQDGTGESPVLSTHLDVMGND